MEFLIPIYRLIHFLGLALLLGGILCSVILVRTQESTVATIKTAWNCMHLVAAPGLMLLLLSGILQSSALYWEHFKGAGYMHAKMVLVLGVLVLMVFDMRTQKNILRSNPDADILSDLVKKRQVIAVSVCAMIVLIMWLVSFRPF